MPQVFETLQATQFHALAPYLTTVRFPQGACILREGAPGDGCYFVEEGIVRIEIERPEIDTDGVLSYNDPASILPCSTVCRAPRVPTPTLMSSRAGCRRPPSTSSLWSSPPLASAS